MEDENSKLTLSPAFSVAAVAPYKSILFYCASVAIPIPFPVSLSLFAFQLTCSRANYYIVCTQTQRDKHNVQFKRQRGHRIANCDL